MKKLLVFTIALFTLNGVAQERSKKQDNRKAKHGQRAEMTPSEIADLKSKKMTLKLDLTDAQQSKVQKLILKQTETNQQLRKSHKTTKGEENARPSKEERLKMQSLRLDQKIEMKRGMKAILTADQYAKFEKMKPKKSNKKKDNDKKRRKKHDEKR